MARLWQITCILIYLVSWRDINQQQETSRAQVFFYCTWNFSLNGFLWSLFPHLCTVQISSPEDKSVSLTVWYLQPKTAGGTLILMPSMDKQRKFQEPLGLLCLSLNCTSALNSIQRETYCAECFSALSNSEYQKEKGEAICQPK